VKKLVLCLLALLALLPRENLNAAQADDPAKQAEELYTAGYLLTELGRHPEAIQFYLKSLAIRPTAEAYTFLGWTYGHLGVYEHAIEYAEKAIRTDPEYGNPYNDIGVYLIEQGKEDEAIPYLEKAKRAKRYCCYQFPYFNMGRIYIKKNQYEKAREEFKKALEIDPGYLPAREVLELLKILGARES
jgi:tetratricopeptide (TPR) repeat protein